MSDTEQTSTRFSLLYSPQSHRLRLLLQPALCGGAAGASGGGPYALLHLVLREEGHRRV